MRLIRPHRPRIGPALALATSSLLLSTGAAAQVSGPTEDVVNDVGATRVDAAVLVYQESGGRVRAVEPVLSGTLNSSSGDVLHFRLTSDTLTGATPNGAAPWSGVQTFLTPAQAPGKTASVTSASGNSTIVTLPGTGTVARQYTAAANTLPVDSGFHDQRYAIDAGYTLAWDSDTRIDLGGGFSIERDYTSYSVNSSLSRDLFHKNLTLSAAVNFEFDQSRPYFGTPTPFTVMNANPKGPDASKTVTSLVLGATQVVNRYWLAQLSYSAGFADGYQTDPYRIISVVDPISGAPINYLYEKRPGTRFRQSLYFGNKLAIGSTFADLSGRIYRDSWGITSYTVEISERVPITSWMFIEPSARYYNQTAASFFHDYLLNGAALPAYASSDSRLDKFGATTYGVKVGFRVIHSGELYLQAYDYRQIGNNHPAGAVGALKQQTLFAGVSAFTVVAGFNYAFY